MNKNIVKISLVLGIIFLLSGANSAVAAAGDLFVDKGTVYYTNYLGQRRPFSSAEIFFANGFTFSQVRPATSADLALPLGTVMAFPDGTLVKANNNPTVYVIRKGQKRPFATLQSFLSRGYSFSNVFSTDPIRIAIYPTGNAYSQVAGATTEEE